MAAAATAMAASGPSSNRATNSKTNGGRIAVPYDPVGHCALNADARIAARTRPANSTAWRGWDQPAIPTSTLAGSAIAANRYTRG